MEKSTCSSAEPRANLSRSQDLEAVWTTSVVTSRLNFADLLREKNLVGLSGKTSPVSCHRAEDGTLVPSSGRWKNSGMASPTECLTLSTAEWTAFGEQYPSGGVVSSLSDILETGDVPQRFYLSARACSGILRRAGKRGKELPTMLHRALQQVTGGLSEPVIPEAKIA
jgi:hypothetical protein